MNTISKVSGLEKNEIKRAYTLDLPAGSGPFPCLVLAPGLRYGMQRELFLTISTELTRAGIAVARFDWVFFQKNPKEGQPSADLSAESRQLREVVRQLRLDDNIHFQQIALAGKSFGSVVAWRVLCEDAKFKAGIFLTPLFDEKKDGPEASYVAARYYPYASSLRLPLMMLTGDQDAHCSTRSLYRFAFENTSAIRIAVVSGDHGFSQTADAKISENSHPLVAAHILDFLRHTAFA